MLMFRPTYCYSSMQTNWDFLTEVSEGIKPVTAGGVGLNCEPERAGNAGVHFKRATSVTLTGLVADGGSLRFIIKGYPLASRPFFPRLTVHHAPNVFRSAGRHLRTRVWSCSGIRFRASRTVALPFRALAPSLHQFNCQGSLTSFNCQP